MKNYIRTRVAARFSLAILIVLSTLLAACGDNTATTAATTTAAGAATTTAGGAATTTTAASGATTTAGAATTVAGTTTAAAPAPTITPIPAVPQPAGSTKIVFWYGLTGSLGNVVQQTVNRYNQSQTKYYIDAVQQPSYDDTINKVNTTLAGGNLPNLLQIYDIGSQRMIDSKRILPVQDFIERDKLQDAINDLEPAVKNYYTIGGKLYSMPFNTSTAMMYYDRNAMKEAGLDPDKKIWTYEEFLDIAKKLTKKDASGKVIRAGIGYTADGWTFEQQLAVQNSVFAEPSNGRLQRANKLVFNNEAGMNWLNVLKKAQDEGSLVNYGQNFNVGGALVKGDAAIVFQSIASLLGTISSAEQAGGKVSVGVAYLPRPAGAKGGTYIGGASLWITDQGTKEQQEAAWDFIKFAIQADTQAFWSANTGYYPIRKSSYQLQEMKDVLTKYPQFQVAIDQIRDTPPGPATSGAVFGTFVATRQEIQAAIDNFLKGKYSTSKDALDDAAKKSNEKLEEYNSTVK